MSSPVCGARFVLRRISLQLLHDLLCQKIGTYIAAGTSAMVTAGKLNTTIEMFHRLE